MKEQDYIKRNLQGFEGDNEIFKEIKRIAKENHIKVAVETGTYLGGTTKRLTEIFTKVHTIECDPLNCSKSREYLHELIDHNRVVAKFGDSAIDLLPMIQKIKQEKVFFFLDAHWGDHCPLIDELEQIAISGKTAFIAIHDFYNPFDLSMGYDEYNGQKLEINYISEALEKVYPNGFDFHYNKKAEGARRGIIYILPTLYPKMTDTDDID
jgi:hypothetical protein